MILARTPEGVERARELRDLLSRPRPFPGKPADIAEAPQQPPAATNKQAKPARAGQT